MNLSKLGLRGFTVRNMSVMAIGFLILATATFMGARTVYAAVLGVTQISAVQTFATADGSFENGWRWVFDVTVPTDETIMQMKFADLTNGSNTIPATDNIRYFSTQSSNAADAEHALMVTAPAIYAGAMKINPGADLDVAKNGRQIQITVEARVPVNSAGGSYSTSYGIKSNPDPDVPVITVDVYNTSLTNSDVVVTASTSTGSLNETSHTFTQNGSFDFIATGPTGIITTRTVTVTNVDKTPPVIASHADVTVNADSSGSAVVNYQLPSVTDTNPSGSAVCSPAPGSILTVGSHIATCTAVDSAGNDATPTSFNIIVDPLTSLMVSLASSPSSQTVTRGATVNSIRINFNTGSTSDVKITQIKLRGLISLDGTTSFGINSTDSNAITRQVQDVIQSATIWDGTTQLGMARSPDSNGDMNFTSLSWTIPAGTTKTITVKVLLSNNLPYGSGTNSFVIDLIGDGTAATTTANVTALDKDANTLYATGGWSDTDFHLQQGTTVTAAATMVSDANTVIVTVVGSGILQIGLDSDTPSASILTANTNDNSVTRLKFTSINEGFLATRLTIENTNANSSRSITSVRLFDKNGTLFCSGALDSNSRLRCANDAGLFTVANDQVITIKVNLDQEGSGTTGANSGDKIIMALYVDQDGDDALADDLKIVGVSSGTSLTDANAKDQGSDGFNSSSLKIFDDMTESDDSTVLVSGNTFVIRKTQPTVATVASSTTLINGEMTVYKFSVTAASNADVTLKQFNLNMSRSGVALGSYCVFENGTALDSSLYTIRGYDIAGVASPIDLTTANVLVQANDGGRISVLFNTERTVAAGTTKVYDIKATISGAALGDSLTHVLADDASETNIAGANMGTAVDVIGDNDSNFVWSDTSADAHSTSTADWTNGFHVKTLPTSARSLSL